MAWDFSGEQPDIIVYETQAPLAKRFRASLIEKRVDEKGKESRHEWLIYFDATTFEGAIKRADLWWLDGRAKHDKAIADAADRAVKRSNKGAS